MTPLIRVATHEDLRYVRHAWTKQAYAAVKSEHFHLSRGVSTGGIVLPGMKGTYGNSVISYALYDRLFRPMQERIFAVSTCLVAVNPDDNEQVLGFVIHTAQICYFIQVKSDFWNRGIAKALLARAGLSKEAPIVYAFPTPLSSVPKAWVFVPWYLHAEIMKNG